jgi:hypothetical protein
LIVEGPIQDVVEQFRKRVMEGAGSLIYPIPRKQWVSTIEYHSLQRKYLTMEHLRLAH